MGVPGCPAVQYTGQGSAVQGSGSQGRQVRKGVKQAGSRVRGTIRSASQRARAKALLRLPLPSRTCRVGRRQGSCTRMRLMRSRTPSLHQQAGRSGGRACWEMVCAGHAIEPSSAVTMSVLGGAETAELAGQAGPPELLFCWEGEFCLHGSLHHSGNAAYRVQRCIPRHAKGVPPHQHHIQQHAAGPDVDTLRAGRRGAGRADLQATEKALLAGAQNCSQPSFAAEVSQAACDTAMPHLCHLFVLTCAS